MRKIVKPVTILMADDDADDCKLTKEMFEECRVPNELRFVENGEELLDCLWRRGRFQNQEATSSRPGLILLDLHMPRKDGLSALKEIKADPVMRQIPVVVLTSSMAEDDIFRSYDLGVTSYIVKPVTFEALLDVLQTFEIYWFRIVEMGQN